MTVIHNAVSGKEGRSPIQVESPTTDDSQHWNYAKNRWMRAAHCNIWSPVDRPENSTLNYPSNAETQMTHNKREGNYATAEEETSLHSCIDARCFVSGAICCRAFSRQLLRWDIEQSGRVFSTLCQLERHGKSRPQEAAGWVRRYSTNHSSPSVMHAIIPQRLPSQTTVRAEIMSRPVQPRLPYIRLLQIQWNWDTRTDHGTWKGSSGRLCNSRCFVYFPSAQIAPYNTTRCVGRLMLTTKSDWFQSMLYRLALTVHCPGLTTYPHGFMPGVYITEWRMELIMPLR